MVSIGTAVAVVAICTLGVLALTGALLSFAACATMVLYSIYLIVPRLHH